MQFDYRYLEDDVIQDENDEIEETIDVFVGGLELEKDPDLVINHLFLAGFKGLIRHYGLAQALEWAPEIVKVLFESGEDIEGNLIPALATVN